MGLHVSIYLGLEYLLLYCKTTLTILILIQELLNKVTMLKQIFKRGLSISSKALAYNHPITSKEMLRAGGIASMYRLPVYKNTDGKVYAFFKLVFFFYKKRVAMFCYMGLNLDVLSHHFRETINVNKTLSE